MHYNNILWYDNYKNIKDMHYKKYNNIKNDKIL